VSHLLTIPAPCDWLRLNGGHGNRYAKAGLIRTVIGPDMRAGDSWADAALVLTIEQIGDAA
jgi:hypothetical protein